MTGSGFCVNYTRCIYSNAVADFWVGSEEPPNRVGGTPQIGSEEPPLKTILAHTLFGFPGALVQY